MVKTLDTRLVVSLVEAAEEGIERVGGKAATLGRLRREGFRVPDGLVLATDAFRHFCRLNHLTPDRPPEEALSGRVPPEVRAALEEALARLEGPVAVRSSGAAEDSAGASYAGQYETILNVEGLDHVEEAVRRCWASTLAASVVTYRRVRDDDGTGSMAVLVQSMVPAEAAGVCFTVDPVTGDEQVVIEAVAGLGDALLAGEAIPERWISSPPAEPQRAVAGPEGAVLTEKQARAVSETSLRIAGIMGSPQDVEWAIAGGEVHVLQSRPITALPLEPVIEVPEGQTWVREDEHFAAPMNPLTFHTWLPRLEAAFAMVFAELGMPLQTIGHRLIGGWPYRRLVPVGSPAKDRPPPPAPVFGLLLRAVPALRARMRAAAQAIASDLPRRLMDAWESGGREALRSRNQELRRVDLGAPDDGALADHIEEVLSHLQRVADEHFLVGLGATFVSAGRLGVLMERLLGWEPDRTIQLLQGYGAASAEDGRALEGLAEAVGADPQARRLLEEDPARLADHPGGGGEALREFLERDGHRLRTFDLAHPTYAEDPLPLLAIVRSRLEGERNEAADPRGGARAAEEEARGLLADRPEELARFEEMLERARRARPYNDETEAYVGEALALVRYAAVEAGGRLAAAGVIPDRDAVAFLTPEELVAALRRGSCEVDVERRRGEYWWALAHPAPKIRGPLPAPPPDLRFAPKPARPMMEAFLWTIRNVFAEPPAQHEGEGLRGLAASPGRVTGTARVILSPAEFDQVRAGDVLVAPCTMASWSVLFPVVSAVVTEYGGPLSHPATLAREFGIPAVVSVPEVTERLRSGETVMVDGTSGVVKRIAPAQT